MKMRDPWWRMLPVLCLLAMGLAGNAGTPPGYRYGETWWQEYAPDDQTALLLHFGRPRLSPVQQVRATIAELKKEDETKPQNPLAEGPDDGGEPPINDAQVLEGTVLDYSAGRKVLTLPAGAKIFPQGRFGEGLALDGTNGLRVDEIPGAGPVECWFRVAAPPKKTACIFSVSNDEACLLLLPDGRLELKLKKPHGIIRANTMPAEREEILARDATIRTTAPVTLGAWHHVAVYNEIHVVQGAGSPFDATIRLDGATAAHYLSENSNDYRFLGSNGANLMLGNNFSLTQGFAGEIDEVRVSNSNRNYHDLQSLTWRDAAAARPVLFNKPYFRRDGAVFHAALDHGARYELGSTGDNDIRTAMKVGKIENLLTDGIRGKGWVMDPVIGFPRFTLNGMSARQGTLEFWLRPVNWDDTTGYWQHSPPKQKDLSVLRLYGTDPQTRKAKIFLNLTLPRAYNLERSRVPMDPGHWLHCLVTWGDRSDSKGSLFINGQYQFGGLALDEDILQRVTPDYAEFGVTEDVSVVRGDRPVIDIDEVAGYNYPLAKDEVVQAYQRWQGAIDPIRLYEESFSFKWSLQRLEFSLTPKLPDGVTPASCTVALVDKSGKTCLGPVTATTLKDNGYTILLNDGPVLPFGAYTFRFSVKDTAGKTVIDGARTWEYAEEPWRHYQGGILDKVPAPWTPLLATPTGISTRMTQYTLGRDGLPAQITADGAPLLAGPVQLLENGQALPGAGFTLRPAGEMAADWNTTFTGATCTVAMQCHAEYDGMIRYALAITPKGPRVEQLTFLIPLHGALAKRYLYYPMGERGVRTGEVRADDGVVFESRYDPVPYDIWKGFLTEQAKQPQLSWPAYWEPRKADFKRYGFYGHLDLNDMNRGLWWFCDNAAGWAQSPETSAIQVVHQGDRVLLRLNLVAEAGAYQPGKPIVFAILPHPARPLPEKYRLYQRVDANTDNKACDIFDAFRPWPMDPRRDDANHMRLYPAADPDNPKAGPSWEYAEKCLPNMKANKPTGTRTIYLSKAWFSCRVGVYDNWEWRSGETGTVSLTPSFVNYLCWEMNEWIKRGIWEAIYLDECYEAPTSNVEAGQAVRLPDGSVQPGVTNFQFRELMKRWRNLFTANGKEPLLMAHHTYSWQYPGLLYCDAYLDGENRPIVSLDSKDWIGSTRLSDFEVVQNCRLWGMTAFYMPFIAEGGFNDKERSRYPRWQWRMARQAQSMFAHYETATVYECQGKPVYRAFWDDLYRWGAQRADVTFHPYWTTHGAITQPDNDTLVSYYQGKQKVLLIVSNRRVENRVIPVKLDLAALGLPATVKVKNWDTGLKPPPGADYLPGKDPKGPEEPDDADAPEEPEFNVLQPLTLLDGVVNVPVRGRDFRVLAIE